MTRKILFRNTQLLFFLNVLLIPRIAWANNGRNSSNSTMAQKRTVPTISTLEDLKKALPDYLNNQRKLALFLDFDGTLARLTANPDNAKMPKEIRDSLVNLSENPQIDVVITSGRGLSDIKVRAAIPNITYSGNHGFEIEYFPEGKKFLYEFPEELRAKYSDLIKELNEKVAKDGAWVEDKKFSTTFHTRGCSKEVSQALSEEAKKIIEAYGFVAQSAHCAIEGRPPINWNKGEAALLILKEKFGKNWMDDVGVIYAGDDTTDEDGMRALQGHGKTFRISSDPKIETYADYRLPEQATTALLLRWIESIYSEN